MTDLQLKDIINHADHPKHGGGAYELEVHLTTGDWLRIAAAREGVSHGLLHTASDGFIETKHIIAAKIIWL